MIFAREISDPLTSLVKKLDAATAANQPAMMGSFVVFCNESEGLDKQLREWAAKQGLKHIILSIDKAAGPEDFDVAKEADITVVLYSNHKIEANYAFKKGELKKADVEKIVKDVPKILPKK